MATTLFGRMSENLLWKSNQVGTRLTLALGEFCWAVMLFWPGNTFDRPTYSHMHSVMTEEWWACLFLWSAFTQVYIVVKDRYHTFWSWQFAGWNFLLWFYTVCSMLASVYPPPAAIGGEIALTVSAGWIWLRPLITKNFNKY